MRAIRTRFTVGMPFLIAGCAWVLTANAGSGRLDDHRVSPEFYAGRALFLKEWKPNEPGRAGDGLGPLYNEASCVGCHNQGGPGGGGSAEHDVRLLAVFPRSGSLQHERVFRGELVELHPGLRDRTSVVLHAKAVPIRAIFRSRARSAAK